jgi:hypothetical protein
MKETTTRLSIAVGDALLGGWALMLAAGIAHHDWVPTLPTIGYWPAVAIAALIRASSITNFPLKLWWTKRTTVTSSDQPAAVITRRDHDPS